MDFDAVLKTIGALVLGLFIMAIPVLCGLSFGCNWHYFVKCILVVMLLIECVIVIDKLTDI